MIVTELAVGPLMANCFIVGCEVRKRAAVIDPGGDVDRILAALEQDSLVPVAIINTHGHFDHVSGNRALKAATGAELMIHRGDLPMLRHLAAAAASWGLAAEDSPLPDRELSDGDLISVGEIKLEVIHTPGHTPGGISLFAKAERILFVGDSLFFGSIGRTDFPGGDHDTLIRSIREKLFPLGDDVTVYCGHGPSTTIGQEKRFNPFVRL